MTWFFFALLSALAVGGGLGVVSSRNVVHSALFLLLSLLAVAGLYVLLATEFLALVQIRPQTLILRLLTLLRFP